jgi:hypothetical protein
MQRPRPISQWMMQRHLSQRPSSSLWSVTAAAAPARNVFDDGVASVIPNVDAVGAKLVLVLSVSIAVILLSLQWCNNVQRWQRRGWAS